MMIEEQIHSDMAVPPGEYLEEVLDALAMTKDELAKRMNRPAPKLSAIFKGCKMITPETALQLEKVVGVPAHIWTGLESEYRLALARIIKKNEREHLKAESKLVTRYRYADLVKMGVVKKFTQPADKVLALQHFFGVTSLNAIPDLKRYKPIFRSGQKKNKGSSPEAIASWLRIGERAAAQIHCAPFDSGALKKSVYNIRALTHQPPSRFQTVLIETLLDCGVALIICPHMPRTGIHGATFWMGTDKAVVMMTIRYKWTDIFWFSLFHELGHVLLHGRNMMVLEGAADDTQSKKREHQADKFAADVLIPFRKYKEFIRQGNYFSDDIQSFAKAIGIVPGIVVGRLQNDGLLEPSWYNDLRKRFEWCKS